HVVFGYGRGGAFLQQTVIAVHEAPKEEGAGGGGVTQGAAAARACHVLLQPQPAVAWQHAVGRAGPGCQAERKESRKCSEQDCGPEPLSQPPILSPSSGRHVFGSPLTSDASGSAAPAVRFGPVELIPVPPRDLLHLLPALVRDVRPTHDK